MVAPPTKKAKTRPQQKGASGFIATSSVPPNGLGTTPYARVAVLPFHVQRLFWAGKAEKDADIRDVKEILQHHRISGPMSLSILHEAGKQFNGYTVQEMFLDGIKRNHQGEVLADWDLIGA